MSVADKLRVPGEPTRIVAFYWDEDGKHRYQEFDGGVLSALLTVVEAAERTWPPPHEIGITSDPLFNEVHRAFAALDDALGGDRG